jgi:hypothetical protein
MKLALLVALGLLGFSAPAAHATLVRVDFAATVGLVQTYDGAPHPFSAYVNSLVGPGTPFGGSFIFDDEFIDPGADEYHASYEFPPSELVLTAYVGGYTFERRPTPPVTGPNLNALHVFPGGVADTGEEYGGRVLVQSNLRPVGASIGRDDAGFIYVGLEQWASRRPFLSTDFSEIPWQVSDWDSRVLSFTFYDPDTFEPVAVIGTLTGLSVSPLPEPRPGWLAMLGFVPLLALGFRRARS